MSKDYLIQIPEEVVIIYTDILNEQRIFITLGMLALRLFFGQIDVIFGRVPSSTEVVVVRSNSDSVNRAREIIQEIEESIYEPVVPSIEPVDPADAIPNPNPGRVDWDLELADRDGTGQNVEIPDYTEGIPRVGQPVRTVGNYWFFYDRANPNGETLPLLTNEFISMRGRLILAVLRIAGTLVRGYLIPGSPPSEFQLPANSLSILQRVHMFLHGRFVPPENRSGILPLNPSDDQGGLIEQTISGTGTPFVNLSPDLQARILDILANTDLTEFANLFL